VFVVPGSGGRSGVSSFKLDPSVKDAKVAPGTLRRILGLLRPYRAMVAGFLVLVAVDAVVGAIDPLIYREIINRGILGGDARLVVSLALLIAGLAVLDGGVLLVQRYLGLRIGEGLIYDMRTRVYAHVQRMGLGFFVRTQTGALVSRLDNDVQGAQTALTNVLSTVIGNLMRVTLVLVAMFALSWKLTLIALLLLPLFALPARWVGQRMRRITREGYDLSAEMNTMMVERFNVAGALLVKLFGRQGDEEAEFSRKAARVRDIAVTRGVYGRMFFVSLTLTAALGTALVYGWGGVMAVRGLVDVGTVVALTAYLNRLYGPLTALSNINVDVMTALVSFERVFEVLDLPLLVTDRSGAVTLERGPVRVEFEDVEFSYPSSKDVSLASLEPIAVADPPEGQAVLHGVSFVAEPGQLVALVGPRAPGSRPSAT